MGKILGIILLVVGLGVALYFFNSGGAQKIGAILPHSSSTAATASSSVSGSGATTTASSSNSFFSFLLSILPHVPESTSTQTYLSAASGNLSGDSDDDSGSGYDDQQTGTSQTTTSAPANSTTSPYFGLVRIGGVSQSQISLYTYGDYDDSSTVDITGWEIKTNSGGEYIPQAVNNYDYTGLTPPSDIILTLNQNQYVYFYSNSSPVNLRLNECVGYLNTTNAFNPAMPNNCPSIPQSEISSFTGQCQNYINSLYDCQQPDMSSIYIPQNDYACQQFLENNFTYKSCQEAHQDDPNYLSNEWYVWMGSSPLNEYHDNVELLDRKGLLVDSYSY